MTGDEWIAENPEAYAELIKWMENCLACLHWCYLFTGQLEEKGNAAWQKANADFLEIRQRVQGNRTDNHPGMLLEDFKLAMAAVFRKGLEILGESNELI